MNNLVKKSLYSAIWTLLVAQISIEQVLASTAAGTADTTFGTSKAATVTGKLESATLGEAIQRYINSFMMFLYLIAVIYALWGWFNILTAWGEEDKVKKWKTILIQGWTWLLVIFLAGTIVKWILTLMA